MDAAPRTGYRPSQKLLHWLTVLAVAAQLAVGYNLDLDDDCDPPGEDLGGGDTSDAFEDRLDRLEDACEARADVERHPRVVPGADQHESGERDEHEERHQAALDEPRQAPLAR